MSYKIQPASLAAQISTLSPSTAMAAFAAFSSTETLAAAQQPLRDPDHPFTGRGSVVKGNFNGREGYFYTGYVRDRNEKDITAYWHMLQLGCIDDRSGYGEAPIAPAKTGTTEDTLTEVFREPGKIYRLWSPNLLLTVCDG